MMSAKTSSDTELNYLSTSATRTEKLYMADMVIYTYRNGKIEIGKNRNGKYGHLNLDEAIYYFSKFLAEMKLKDTNLNMFKEGLSKLLRESITKTLKGNYNEKTIHRKSSRDGSI